MRQNTLAKHFFAAKCWDDLQIVLHTSYTPLNKAVSFNAINFQVLLITLEVRKSHRYIRPHSPGVPPLTPHTLTWRTSFNPTHTHLAYVSDQFSGIVGRH